MKTPEPMVPLKHLASLNQSTLPETTGDDHEFTYVDISSVTTGEMSIPDTTIMFGEAPSRARRLARPGDIVISTVRTYLRAVAQVPCVDTDLVFSTGFAVVHPQANRVDDRYLAYAMQADPFTEAVEAISVGVSYPAVNASDVGNVKIWAPALGEQRAIADFLDRETAQIDAMIDAQERLVALLEERRSAATAEAVKSGLTSSVPKKPSGVDWLGDIPAHWRVARLSWHARCRSGDGISTEHIERQADDSHAIPVVGGNGVMGYTDRSNLKGEALAIGRVGALCGNVHLVSGPAWITDNALRLESTGAFDARYLRAALEARRLNDIATKTAQPLITGSLVSAQRLPLPPKDEQAQIWNRVKQTNARTDAIIIKARESIALMKERRAALISAAVTGRIDVRTGAEQIERELEEVMA